MARAASICRSITRTGKLGRKTMPKPHCTMPRRTEDLEAAYRRFPVFQPHFTCFPHGTPLEMVSYLSA
eukprot:6195865-Pleurochrysis_carterae.AAC.7